MSIFEDKSTMPLSQLPPKQRMGMSDAVHPAVGESITPIQMPEDHSHLLKFGNSGYDGLSVKNLEPRKRGCHY